MSEPGDTAPGDEAEPAGTPHPAAVDEARSLLALIHAVTDRADTKAAILIAAFTAAVAGESGILGALLPAVRDEGGVGWWLTFLFALASLGCVLAAATSAALAVRPALGAPYDPPPGSLGPGDLAYFGRLRRLSSERIASELAAAVEHGTMLEHFSEQIQVNSELVWRKHQLIRRALAWFGGAAVAALAAMVVWVVVELSG